MISFNLIIFLLGLCIGSFLNCIIYRLETKQNFLKGWSFCPQCKRRLGFFDLIPVLSFIFLRGKCRYCSQKISLQYPLVELTTGILSLLIFNFQFSPKDNFQFLAGQTIFNQFSIFNFLNLFYYLIIAYFFIIVFVYDLKHYLIPTEIIYLAAVIIMLFDFQFLISKQFSVLNSYLASAAAAGLFFWLIVLLSKERWLGLGDVKLAVLMGLFLGFPKILLALFSAFIIGALIGLVLIFLGKKQLKSEICFGPFLITGAFLALFWGDKIIQWYLFQIFNF